MIIISARAALITGGISGIGKATALALAQLGAEVVISDRAPMDATRDEIQAKIDASPTKQSS